MPHKYILLLYFTFIILACLLVKAIIKSTGSFLCSAVEGPALCVKVQSDVRLLFMKFSVLIGLSGQGYQKIHFLFYWMSRGR